MINRTWVSRDEIADIYDAIAYKAENSEGDLDEAIELSNKRWEQADLYRHIDRMNGPAGTKVA